MRRGSRSLVLVAVAILLSAFPAAGEVCTTGEEIDAASRSAIERTARQYFGYAAAGDVFRLRESSIASLASSFGGIEAVVIDQKANLAAAQPVLRATYLLDAPGNAPIARAEFFCGVWRTPQFAAFVIPNLPPGRYALVLQDANTPGGAYAVSMILREERGAWKLAGYYSRPAEVGGKNADWFLNKAREFKSKGQSYNAWFYYAMAWELTAPLDFMSTSPLDKLSEEMYAARPKDLPGGGPVDLAATGGRTYRITHMSALPVRGELHLLVRYQTPDVSNTQKTFDDNVVVITALVARYPEYREAFAGVVARAVEPSGRDYGTLLAMKDVK
jgi:hypothetical protein